MAGAPGLGIGVEVRDDTVAEQADGLLDQLERERRTRRAHDQLIDADAAPRGRVQRRPTGDRGRLRAPFRGPLARETSADDLATRLKAGDERGWTDVYHRFAGRIAGYARSEGVADPDDLVGEVFVAAAKRISRFEAPRTASGPGSSRSPITG